MKKVRRVRKVLRRKSRTKRKAEIMKIIYFFKVV